MQFTPQQLTGGQQYAFGTRIGNWCEDAGMSEIYMKDYLKKKEECGLLVRAKQKRIDNASQKNFSTRKTDDTINFGDKAQFFSHGSGGYLSANVYDEVPKVGRACAVTTSPVPNPSFRNVFRFERADPNDGFGDSNQIHYGQNFRILLDQPDPSIHEKPADAPVENLYLHSEHITPLSASKFSRHQETLMFSKPNGNTLWQILHPDTRERFDTDEEIVSTEGPCVIRHVQTGSFLASAKIPYSHIFGPEYETHCHTYFSTNKTHNLVSEKRGQITGDYVLRRHGEQNMWNIIFDRV